MQNNAEFILSDNRLGQVLRLYPDFNNDSYFHHTAVRVDGRLYIVTPRSHDFNQYYNTVAEWMQFHGLDTARAIIFADYKPKWSFLHEITNLSAQLAFVDTPEQVLARYEDLCTRYHEMFPSGIQNPLGSLSVRFSYRIPIRRINALTRIFFPGCEVYL